MFPFELTDDSLSDWYRFQIAEALGIGEHVITLSLDQEITVTIQGIEYDSNHKPVAIIETSLSNPDWKQIREAVRQQYPDRLPVRAATEEEYDALKSSISRFGVLQRVIVNQQGEIISGGARQRACDQLNIQCPKEVITTLTPVVEEQLALELELCRKHHTLDDKRRVCKYLLMANPALNDSAIGQQCGLTHKTVAKVRQSMEQRREIPKVTARIGVDGKTYSCARIPTNTDAEQKRAENAFQTLGDQAPSRPLNLKLAERYARDKQVAERKATRQFAPQLPEDSIQILHSDFRDLTIEDGTVKLIVTDPPYNQEGMACWGDFAQFAKRILMPDGMLVCYTGIMFLPEALQALGSELQYVWQVVAVHTDGQDQVHPRNVINRYKSVLIFSNNGQRSPALLHDVVRGSGKEKNYHEWQQNLAEFQKFIELYTEPEDLVVDPFGGAFTTAIACHRLGCSCVSCDIDASAVQAGRERLALERSQTGMVTSPQSIPQISGSACAESHSA